MYTRRNFAVTPRTIGGFFEDVMNNGWNQLNEELSSFTVPVNIQETDKSYELHLVAPGLKKEDFNLNVDRNILQISAEQKTEQTEEKAEKWIRSEYRMKSFKRIFTLNEKIDASKIAAKYADGILVVSLPKKEPIEPTTHQVQVN